METRMSATLADTASLAYREQIARIERAQEETRKFAAEQHKLAAEAVKPKVDRFIIPFVLLGSLGSGVVVAIIAHLIWH
jgi:hypothetical protein